jgi:hypothetical protein
MLLGIELSQVSKLLCISFVNGFKFGRRAVIVAFKSGSATASFFEQSHPTGLTLF